MWRYGPIGKEQKRLGDLLKAIVILKGARSSDVEDDAGFCTQKGW